MQAGVSTLVYTRWDTLWGRTNVQDLGEVERGFLEELMGELNLEEQTQFAGQQKGEKGDARNTELNKAGHTSTSQRLLRAGCAAVFHGSPHLTVTQYYKRGTILSSF